MKKIIVLLMALAIFSFSMTSCGDPDISEIDNNFSLDSELPFSGIDSEELEALGIYPVTRISEADRACAIGLIALLNTGRKDASGIKIPSAAHSDDFPGIYFIWDSKQDDNGYLKVSGAVFDILESFLLTIKQGSIYCDFLVEPAEGQQLTEDNCYVFFISKVNEKNINMVFIGGWVVKDVDPEPDPEQDPESDLEPEQDQELVTFDGNAHCFFRSTLANFPADYYKPDYTQGRNFYWSPFMSSLGYGNHGIFISGKQELDELFGKTYSLTDAMIMAPDTIFRRIISKYNDEFFKEKQLLTFIAELSGPLYLRYGLDNIAYKLDTLIVELSCDMYSGMALPGGTYPAVNIEWFIILEIDKVPADTKLLIRMAAPPFKIWAEPFDYPEGYYKL